MGTTILKLDNDRKLLNAAITLTHPVDLNSVEPIQKSVKITSWMTYNHISLSQKEHDKKMIQMAQVLMLRRNYNPRQSRYHRCDVGAFQFSPSRLRIWLPVQTWWWPSSNLDYFPTCMISGIFCDYYCGIFGYCSKHYIFKKYFLMVDCPLMDSTFTFNFSYLGLWNCSKGLLLK